MGYMNHTTWRAGGSGKVPRPPLLLPISHTNSTDPTSWLNAGFIDHDHKLVVSPHPKRPVVIELVITIMTILSTPSIYMGINFGTWRQARLNQFRAVKMTMLIVDKITTCDIMKRDTFVIPMIGYAVIRWIAYNPGVWPFHCHMLVHLESGMAMAIAEQRELLQTAPSVPPVCSIP